MIMNSSVKHVFPFLVIYFVCLIFVVYELSTGPIDLLEVAVIFAGWLGGFSFGFIYLEIVRYWHSLNKTEANQDHNR